MCNPVRNSLLTRWLGATLALGATSALPATAADLLVSGWSSANVLKCSAEVPDDCETPGDLNGDGVVSVADLLVVIVNWGPCPGGEPFCPGDLDGNGAVGVADLVFVITNWG